MKQLVIEERWSPLSKFFSGIISLEISIRRSSNGGSIILEKLSLVVNYGVSCFDKPRLEALKPVSLERRRRLASHTHARTSINRASSAPSLEPSNA